MAFTYLKVKSAKCLCLLPVVLVMILVLSFWSFVTLVSVLVLVLVLRIWSCLRNWLAWRRNWSLLVKRYRRTCRDRVPPFKVTRGHQKRHGSIGYTYDFLLVLRSKRVGRSRAVSEIYGDFGRKTRNTSQLLYIAPPLMGLCTRRPTWYIVVVRCSSLRACWSISVELSVRSS